LSHRGLMRQMRALVVALVYCVVCVPSKDAPAGTQNSTKAETAGSMLQAPRQKGEIVDPSRWGSPELATWLGENGLESFAPVFEKHRIAGDVLFEMSRSDIVDLMERENALVYGDVVRLQQAMQRLQPRRGGAAQPYYPTGQLSYAEDASGIPSEHKVIHGVTAGLLGWSFTGLTLTAAIVVLAISHDARKFTNILLQVVSIHGFYIGRKALKAFKRYRGSSDARSTSTSAATDSTRGSIASEDTKGTSPQQNATAAAVPAEGNVNLSGTWRLEENIDYEEFLKVSGASWVERKAANNAGATYVITHEGDRLKLVIKSLVAFEADYIIGGPMVETSIKRNRFEDTVTWLPDGRGVRISKLSRAKHTLTHADRRLAADGNTINQSMTVYVQDGSGQQATATQVLRRVN